MKKSERTLTPKLRFPEFRNEPEWKPTPLSALLDYEQPGKYIVEDSNYQDTGTPVLTANKSFVLGHTAETTGVFEDVPVIIFDDFTTDKKYVDFPFKVKSSAIKILRSRGNDELELIYELMSRIRFDPAQHKRYYISQYQNLEIALPSPPEQQKIAECLSSLDGLIAAAGRKLEALKAYKKGIMQQLFPQPGQTQPRLRFPEFRGKGEWVEKRAGSLFSQRKEKGQTGLPIYSVTINDGMVLRSTFDRNFYDIEDPSGNKKACKNDIAYNMMRMWQGACGTAPEDCMVSPAYVVLKPKKGTCPAFFDVLFKRPAILHLLMAYSRGLTLDRLRLYFDDFTSIPLLVPAESEQQRIADYLTDLDKIVTAQAAKIESLTQHKRGLMQQLFPAPEVQ